MLMIILVLLNPTPNENDLTPFIPGTLTSDLFVQFLVLIPLGAIIGSLLGYLFAPLFLMVHKKTVGRTLTYGIQERPLPTKFTKFFRGFFPSLMAINFGLMLSNNTLLVELVLTQEALKTSEAAIKILFTTFLLGWTLGASFALFSSVWFLMEAGIVYNNKEKLKNSDYPVEVFSVGSWYSNLLKGYAGISVIITLYQITSLEILRAGETGNITLVLTLIFFPLLIMIFLLPSVVLFDSLKGHRNQYIRKFAAKLGILNFIDLEIREIQK
jgi:hypothetical protein